MMKFSKLFPSVRRVKDVGIKCYCCAAEKGAGADNCDTKVDASKVSTIPYVTSYTQLYLVLKNN